MSQLKKVKFNLPGGRVINADVEETLTIQSFIDELINQGVLNQKDEFEIQSISGFGYPITNQLSSIGEKEFIIVNKSQQRMQNSKQWSTATPGYIIFLVDQSGSMEVEYPGTGKSRAAYTSMVINKTIYELINTNMAGENVKNRVFISMIGYGGSSSLAVDDIRSDYLSSFADHPLRIEQLKRKIPDGAGGLVEIIEEAPVFVEPLANGLTPMADALSFAKDLIESWLQKMPDNPAPIIINISDGLPYTGDTVEEEMVKAIEKAAEIMAIESTDGNPLIFNSHIGAEGDSKYNFLESADEIVNGQAKFLFKISSKVPESYKEAARKQDFNVLPNSRGFVSNADPVTFIGFINFGSSGGKDKIA